MPSPENSQPGDRQEWERLSQQLRAKLPPHLRFITDVPDMEELDPDELVRFSTEYLGKLRKYRREFSSRGIDVDQMIRNTEKSFQDAIQADKRHDVAQEKSLQLTADAADAQYKYFKAMEAAIKDIRENNPLDPQLPALEAQLEEIRQHMPRE